ncbi:DUF6671 family protein [Evansella sp. AB-rgal1]|uniref:DUF6671 family protein n=1 Tax=Evansella sp. AB-rgal1 TaxID=3242696 RepID=UPI00359E420E
MSMFANRKAVIATMHKKEKVIAPLLEKDLGLQIVVPTNFNSDKYGTFTTEIERAGDQLQAARKKAENAMELTGVTIGIASEGSFGPHPYFPGIAINRELLLFIDKEEDIEIIGYVANTETNFSQKEVSSFEEAYEFAKSVGFPKHGLIAKKNAQSTNTKEIFKGIVSVEELKTAFEELTARKISIFSKKHSHVWMETDMRAMYNPMRMKNIELATLDLVNKIHSQCPKCSFPGYEVVERLNGLKCKACGFPTDLIRCHVYRCKKCNHQEKEMFPNGEEYADPSKCYICNP